MMLEGLRSEVCALNRELPRSGLVVWTGGNVSGCDRESSRIVIKPSGVRYDELTPEKMVVVDLNGRVLEGPLQPSSDTRAHAYVYRHRPDVCGIVHTHSCFATAWAAIGRSIPPVLTAICDEFGGPIPVGCYAPIGGDEIGEEIVRSIGGSPAILMKNHGVFALGPSPESAVKAAVMVEDVARTVYYALQLGEPEEIAPDEVARAHRRYIESYGQPRVPNSSP